MPPLFTVDSGGMAAALQSMRFRRLYLAVLIELALLVLLFTLFTRAASGAPASRTVTPASPRLERRRPAAVTSSAPGRRASSRRDGGVTRPPA